MSKLLEFFLGSLLIAVFSVGLMFFAVLQLVLKASGTVDCAWQGSAKAWLDSNSDGLASPGEPPLPAVTIHVDDVMEPLIPLGDAGWTAVTDKDGDVQFNIPIPECAETTFQIYADLPAGYRLTTKPRIAVNSSIWQAPGKERIYYFGFVPER